MKCLLCILTLRLTVCAADPTLPWDGQAKTPPMGWNSWNLFGCTVTETDVRSAADAVASNGMREAGYTYITVDDCWQGKRDSGGNIQPNAKFLDVKALADYIHAKGLKFGIYSSPGPKTCGGYEGSYGHEEQDAATYAAWGVDYLKYDMCSARHMFQSHEWRGVYAKMAEALRKTGRPIIYSISHGDNHRVWSWAPSAGVHLWRTGGDIQPRYDSFSLIAFLQAGLEPFAGPGHWNDPDMLQVGNGRLTPDENRQHFGLWCLMAAPLFAGNDLTKMNDDTRAILTNREAIAIDQDAAGIQGRAVWQEGPLSVWAKPLADGDVAIGLVNRGESANQITALFSDLGLGEHAKLRDILAGRDLGTHKASYTAEVPKRGIVLLRASGRR